MKKNISVLVLLVVLISSVVADDYEPIPMVHIPIGDSLDTCPLVVKDVHKKVLDSNNIQYLIVIENKHISDVIYLELEDWRTFKTFNIYYTIPAFDYVVFSHITDNNNLFNREKGIGEVRFANGDYYIHIGR